MADLKNPDTSEATLPAPELSAGLVGDDKQKLDQLRASPKGPKDAHPSGKESYGPSMQLLRGLTFAAYFNTCIIVYVYGSEPPRPAR